MRYLISLFISSAIGFLLIEFLTQKKPVDVLQKAVLGAGIGLGLSGHIGFYSLLIHEQYNPLFVWVAHGCVLLVLMLAVAGLARRRSKTVRKPSLEIASLLGLLATSLILIPLWREAHFFPFGGWDAWSCWNLKARFIYLGGEQWKNMLDPLLWRSNNHYPFLLPLINVWGWTFYGDTNVTVPLCNAVVFAFLTAALMFASLQRLTGQRWAFIAPVVLFSLPFVNKLSISQYSDIVVAFYLLAALCSLIQAGQNHDQGWAMVGGLCTGLLSFTKTEGLVASALLMLLSIPFFLSRGRNHAGLLSRYLASACVMCLPAIIFKMAWAPANAAFINGLTSPDHASNLERLAPIFMFLAVELVSLKWNGLWIVLVAGIVLSGKHSLHEGRWIIPLTVLGFLGCALAYYYINTYFELIWWLKVTLNRVLYTILPAVTWWTFASLWTPAKK